MEDSMEDNTENNTRFKKINIQVAFWQGVLGLVIIIGGLVSATFNFLIAYQLTPLSQNLDTVRASVDNNNDTLADHESRIRDTEKRINAYEGSVNSIEVDLNRLTNYFFEGK